MATQDLAAERLRAEIEAKLDQLEAMRREANACSARIAELEAAFKTALAAYADATLPDLEPETLAALREAAPWFVDARVSAVFAAAERVEVPLLATLTFRAARRRKEALAGDFDRLRIQLQAGVAAHLGAHESTLALKEVSDRMAAAQRDLAAQPSTAALETEIGRLIAEYERLTGQSFSRGATPKNASEDREEPWGRRDSGDTSDTPSGWSGRDRRSEGAPAAAENREAIRSTGDFRTGAVIGGALGADFTTNPAASIMGGVEAGAGQGSQAGESSAGATDRGDLS